MKHRFSPIIFLGLGAILIQGCYTQLGYLEPEVRTKAVVIAPQPDTIYVEPETRYSMVHEYRFWFDDPYAVSFYPYNFRYGYRNRAWFADIAWYDPFYDPWEYSYYYSGYYGYWNPYYPSYAWNYQPWYGHGCNHWYSFHDWYDDDDLPWKKRGWDRRQPAAEEPVVIRDSDPGNDILFSGSGFGGGATVRSETVNPQPVSDPVVIVRPVRIEKGNQSNSATEIRTAKRRSNESRSEPVVKWRSVAKVLDVVSKSSPSAGSKSSSGKKSSSDRSHSRSGSSRKVTRKPNH